MLIRPYKVSDVRDYFIGMKSTGLNHTTDKTGVKCIELIGASFEAGNLWEDSDSFDVDDTLFAGSLFVVFDTLIGPIYIAYGMAEGGRQSAYLYLGQTF